MILADSNLFGYISINNGRLHIIDIYIYYIQRSSIEIRLQEIGLHLESIVHPPFSDTLNFSPVRASERNPQALQRYSVCFATDPARFPGVNSIWWVKSLGTPKKWDSLIQNDHNPSFADFGI